MPIKLPGSIRWRWLLWVCLKIRNPEGPEMQCLRKACSPIKFSDLEVHQIFRHPQKTWWLMFSFNISPKRVGWYPNFCLCIPQNSWLYTPIYPHDISFFCGLNHIKPNCVKKTSNPIIFNHIWIHCKNSLTWKVHPFGESYVLYPNPNQHSGDL